MIPTNDATLVGAYFPLSEFGRVRTDAMAAYLDSVGTTAPAVRERMAGAAPLERLYGTGDQRNFFRVAAGRGWALAGDAAHRKDSITARGITDAFRQAEALVAAVGTDPHDEQRVHAGLRSYAAGFVDMFAEAYQGALFAALLSVDEQRLAMLRAVSSSRELTERYFGTIAGTCSLEALYTPELVNALGG